MNCPHPGCRCQVEGGQKYCSEYCERHALHPEGGSRHVCECGHTACRWT
jgi:hypothetical protein